MPCIFCIAMVVTGVAGLTAAVIEAAQQRLVRGGASEVKRVSETESVTRLEFGMKAGKKTVPVAITFFKEHGRARIQILSHDLSREEAEKIENRIADLLDLKIVERSDAESEAKVRESFEVPGGRRDREPPTPRTPPPIPRGR